MANLPATRREKVAWAVAGAAITLVVAYVLSTFVGAIVVGIFLYYATRPVYRRLDARFDHPDWNATATLLLIGLPLIIVLAYAGLVGVRELDQFLSNGGFEEYRSLLQPYVDVAELTDPRELLGRVRDQLPSLISAGVAVVTWVFRLFIIFVVAFYLLRTTRRSPGGSVGVSARTTTPSPTWRASTTTSRPSTSATSRPSGPRRPSPSSPSTR